MMAKPIVIYHAGCWDGFCAAWLFYNLHGDDYEYMPAQHGDAPPDVTGREVFVVDFCYSAAVTAEIIHKAKSVVILDHHKTAEAELKKLDGMTLPADVSVEIRFDMNKSGGSLTWEWLCDEGYIPMRASDTVAEPPWIVRYTEDRDLWRHKLAWTKEINAYIRSFPLDFELWDRWYEDDPLRVDAKFVEAGAAILRRQQQIIDASVSRAYEVDIAGHKVLAVNSTEMVSEIGQELAKGRPFGAVFFVQQNQRVWSLRSDENGVDVSEIAKQLGGGGHKHAAGYQEKM